MISADSAPSEKTSARPAHPVRGKPGPDLAPARKIQNALRIIDQMCLILLSHNAHPTYRLILAANRDEFHNRPTAPLHFWKDKPDILAGRDIRGGGTWLGITRTGRIAALTNVREPDPLQGRPHSRGLLVRAFLDSDQSPVDYLADLAPEGTRYDGFNLLVGDHRGLYCYSNREGHIRKLSPGIHGLSNRLLNTPWPKVERGKALFDGIVGKEGDIDTEALLEMLEDNRYPPKDRIPDTGVGPFYDFICSPIFVTSEFYGTRSAAVLLVEHSGKATFRERTFVPVGGVLRQKDTLLYTLP